VIERTTATMTPAVTSPAGVVRTVAFSATHAGMPAMQEPITQTEGQAESAPCIPRR